METFETPASNRLATGRPAVEHDLKCWSAFFPEVLAERKKAEIRRFDRDYRVGDYLRLREYDPDRGEYTGRWSMHRITHILRKAPAFGLMDGFAMLSITESLARGVSLP